MDIKIKKIFQFGTYNEENEWTNDGETVVIYEDESKAPLHVSGREAYKAFDEYAAELGIDTDASPESIDQAIVQALENGLLGFYDKNNTREMNAALVEIAEAERKANAANLDRRTESPVVVPPIVVPPSNDPESLTPPSVPDNHPEDEDEITAPEVVETEEEKGSNLKKGIALGLAGAAGLGAIATLITRDKNQIPSDSNSETTKDLEDNQTQQGLDYSTASFEELMNSMSEEDPRRQTAETAMTLVTTFHDATRKDGNFRLEADGSCYLDFSYEEGLVLALFANNGTTEEMYSVLGDYNLTSEQAQNLLESARNKLITYYMNANEPSGLANIFTNEQDKAFFENFEKSVLAFNNLHAKAIETEQNKEATAEQIKEANAAAKTASDDVIRNVYYNYLLDGAASLNATSISPLAKLLAFDAVYGGLNLTESASAEHTHHLEFGGLGEEKETEWYVTNILKLDYSSLSEEEKETYRRNIIESGMQLVKLNEKNEVMNEDNSTKDELDSASVSITNLVDQMGLCNQANQEISEKMEKLNALAQQKELQLTIMNQEIARGLRSIGTDELDAIATQIEMNASEALSADLLQQIRNASTDSANIVKGYEQSASFIVRAGIPGIDVIIEAANEETKAQNYAEGIGMVATLINNRRHTPTQKEHAADENGFMGKDENGIPTYSEESYNKAEDKNQFIVQNGVEIGSSTNVNPTGPKEEVKYEDLTDQEKEQAQVQINEQKSDNAKKNAKANGEKQANNYCYSTDGYEFGVDSVTNPHNKEVHDLNGKTFFDTINYLVAFGDSQGVPTDAKEDSQIKKAAEEAALVYVESLSEQEKSDIATAMGMNWSKAKDVLMESFKTGYFEKMNEEIKFAIEVGKEHKESAAKAAEEALKVVEQPQQQETVATTESVVEQPVDNVPTESAPEKPVDTAPTQPAPEKPVDNVPTEPASETTVDTAPTQPAPETTVDTAPTQPAPEKPADTTPTESDKYDSNVDIATQEGEMVVPEEDVVLNPQPKQQQSGIDEMLNNLTDEQMDQILGLSTEHDDMTPGKTR